MKLCAFADEAAVDIKGQINALKRNNIDLIELRGIDGKNISEVSKKKISDVARLLNENGIRVWSIGSPVGKISVDDDFNSHLEIYKKLIEFAHILKADNMRIFSFYPSRLLSDNENKEVCFSRLDALINQRDGITLCHENEKGIYGSTPLRVREIHRAFPDIKSVFDPANYLQCDCCSVTSYNIVEQYIEYMHIKDALGNGIIVPAGEGLGNISVIIDKFNNKYNGVITVEPHLTEFVGLKSLERSGEKSDIGRQCYRSSDEAFDTAVNSVKKIISEVTK